MRLLSAITNHLFTKMKSLKLATTSLFIASALFAADGTVSSTGGNWSNDATWVDGAKPTSDGKVIFSTSGSELTVDSSQTASAIKSSVSGTVNIASGATLKLTGAGTSNPVFDAGSNNNTFTVNGVDNTSVLDFGAGGEMFMKNGTFDFNAKTITTRGLSLYSKINIKYQDSDLYDTDYSYYGNQYSAQASSVFTVKTGASARFTGGVANWGVGSIIKVESGAYMKVGGGIRTKNTSVNNVKLNQGNTLEVAGRVDIDGVTASGTTGNNFGIYAANLIVSGELNVNTTSAHSYITNTLVSTGTIVLKKDLFFADGAIITLGAGSDIRTNDAPSQEYSMLNIAMKETLYNNARPVVQEALNGAANVTLNLEADQALGGFILSDGSKLTVNLKSDNGYHKLALNGFNGSTFSVIFEDFKNDLVSVENSDSLTVDKVIAYGMVDGVRTELTDLQYKDGFLYSATMIPEPAEWAAIFGALALGLAVYRRRK